MIEEDLGIKPVINCTGTLTLLGGNIVEEEVVDAMKEAARSFFDMQELHRKAGEFVAKLLGAEAAYIVNGAEAGLVLSLASCLTRGDIEKMVSLPDLGGEVIVQKLHRNLYDYIIRFTGAKVVEIGGKGGTTRRDLESAINEHTVASVYFAYDPQDGVLPLEQVSEICRSRGVPVIADAAAELPPKENFTRFLSRGADLVLFSGGKDIGAPNDTGLVIGRKDLIEGCRILGPQSYIKYKGESHIFIGRPLKTSKEDVFAFVAALKKYLSTNDETRASNWEKTADFFIERFKRVAKVRKIYGGPRQPRPTIVPKVEIELPVGGINADDFVKELRAGDPPIAAYAVEGKLYLNVQCLKDGDEKIVAERMLQLLDAT